MMKSISVVAAVALALCFATAVQASGQKGPKSDDEDDTPKPLPPLQKNFPLDQTWSLRELNGKPVPAGIGHQPEDRRVAARLGVHRMQFVVGDACIRSRISISPSAPSR